MKVEIVLIIFIIFVGISGSVLRKKPYKRILNLLLSFNGVIVFSSVMANSKHNSHLWILCFSIIFITVLIVGIVFYIYHERSLDLDEFSKK